MVILSDNSSHVKRGEPHNDYLSDKAVSQSQLKMLDKTPAHFKEFRDNPEPPTPAQEFGTAFHFRLSNPNDYSNNFKTPDQCEGHLKNGKECSRLGSLYDCGWYCHQHVPPGSQPSKTNVISVEDDETIYRMNEAIYNHKESSKILSLATPDSWEVSLRWEHAKYKFKSKARPDIVLPKEGIIVDIKTTIDSGPECFSHAVHKFKYYWQASWYLMAARICFPSVKWTNFVIIAVEKKRPYAVSVNNISDYYVEIGNIEIERLSSVYHNCLTTNEWSGYGDINSIEPPEWLLRKYERTD